MTQQFTQIFEKFVNAYIESSDQHNNGLLTEYSPEWSSPCLQITETALTDGDEVQWLPVKRNELVSLSNVTEALELPNLEALDVLFGSQYSHDLNAKTTRGELTILQVWNDEDFERLQKNLIAHVLMKRRLKQPETLFFAVTDEDDYVVSLDPHTGRVVLEFIGKPDLEVLADSMSDFFADLQPNPKPVYL